MSEKTIPDMLKQHGISGIMLENGMRLEIEEKLFARIPVDTEKREEALNFLYSSGGAELIKEAVVAQVPSQGLIDYMTEHGIPFEEKKEVNTNSLMAWIREMLGMKKGAVQRMTQEQFPKVLGLYTYSKAKLK